MQEFRRREKTRATRQEKSDSLKPILNDSPFSKPDIRNLIFFAWINMRTPDHLLIHMTKMKKFVAYYRVSTDQQGRSGLGLEAQQVAIGNHLKTIRQEWEIAGEFNRG